MNLRLEGVLACAVYAMSAGLALAKTTDKRASFEQVLEDAEPVRDLSVLIEPLFDTCDASDPLAARQCRGARSFLEADVRGKTYVAVGDPAALTLSPYDATTKSVDVEVQGCIACLHPPKLSDGKGGQIARFVTTKVPRAIKGGHALGLEVDSIEIDMTTPEAAKRWKKQEKKLGARLRAQFVFRLGSLWSSGSFSGVSFSPLAYRVFDACSGEVFSESPEPADGKLGRVTTPVVLQAGDNLTCPAPGEDMTPEEKAAKEELAHLPQQLSREEIEHGMSTVQERVHDCHVEFEESGTVNLRLVIEGPTGKVKEAQVLPPFDKTPAGLCVRAALREARFAHTKNETQEVKIPVYLR
jgi:hypothetical protein